MNPIVQKLIAAASALALLAGIYGYIHHEGEKSEEVKIEKQTTKTVAKIQEKKNEIIRQPATDARSIDRLQRGSFFPSR